MDDQAYIGWKGVRHCGQYKPKTAYRLENDFLLIPAGRESIPYGHGGKIHLNCLYFTGPNKQVESDLKSAYRKWLIFDAFVFDDHFPTYFYDNGKSGQIEIIPPETSGEIPVSNYKKINYDDVRTQLLGTGTDEITQPAISYSDLYSRFECLNKDLREMIEWYVSRPFLAQLRADSFFNINYWKIFHLTILFDRLIASPPSCEHSFGVCPKCQFNTLPHYSIRRPDWLRASLESQTALPDIASEYAIVIAKCVSIRNKLAHTPTFDRSAFPDIRSGETETYPLERAINEYLHDAYALGALAQSADRVARYLLADKAFNTKHFPRLPEVKVTLIGKG